MKAGISVVIPAYNREQFIKEAIQSVLDQGYDGPLEIIVSDDGSTDGTISVATSFSDKVKIIRKPVGCKTQGVAGTRNRGIKACSQPFICFLDSDDFYLPGHLKRMASVFEKEPELGFAFCRSLEFKIENTAKLFKPWTRDRLFKNDIKNPVISRSKIVNTNSFIFRKEVFDTVGDFNEAYSNGEDGDLWMRISEQFKGKFVNHFGTAYRTNHGINQLTKNSRSQINECSFLIFEDAKNRYYKLKLNDSRRIFKIKYNLLRLKYRNNNNKKFSYYFRYLSIIIRYPTGYFQKLLESFYVNKEKKGRGNWSNLEKYIS
ncbi:MAG TPA: glycosyltransferase family A protein [Hanamia sp.]|nr:glycosyltransferase family A protein [Hanamia sp.]